MDQLLLPGLEALPPAAPFVAPVLVSPDCAKLLCLALIVLIGVALTDLVNPAKGPRR